MKKLIIIVLFLCIIQAVYYNLETQAVQLQNFIDPIAGKEEIVMICKLQVVFISIKSKVEITSLLPRK